MEKSDFKIIKKINELFGKKRKTENLILFFQSRPLFECDVCIPSYLKLKIKEIAKVECDKLYIQLTSLPFNKDKEKERIRIYTICRLARNVEDIKYFISRLKNDSKTLVINSALIPKCLDSLINTVMETELIKVKDELNSYIINNIG